MQNLGKIFFLCLLLQQSISAQVVAKVDATHVGIGEEVTYNLILSGEDIKKPEIYTLCGEDVIGTSSSTSIQMINGDYKKNYVLSYKFVAKKSCTIESVTLEVDGKKESTQSIDIVVEKIVSSPSDDFSLTLQSDTNEVYVGEAFELTLLLRQKKSMAVVDSKFVSPDFKGFWIKGEPTQESSEDGGFINTKIKYKMAPQREGNLYISPAQIGLASRQNTRNYWGGFFQEVKWKNYFSNDLNITAKPLPEGVILVGNCTIEASVDKNETNVNEAVNLTIKVQGQANLEDIKSFKPYIDGVSVFDEKITIKDDTLTQKITFVADRSFTIPSFSLKLFNPETKSISTIATHPIEINVKNASPKAQEEKLVIKKEAPTLKNSAEATTSNENILKTLEPLFLGIAFVVGIGVGILLMLVKPFLVFKRERKINLKDHKTLLIKLLPFKENEDVKEIVTVLENNLYSQEREHLDAKKLKEIVKKYKLS